MPKVLNDQMVNISEEEKDMIRDLGYGECARITRKSESYMRSLASKGENSPNRMRYSDLMLIKKLGRRK